MLSKKHEMTGLFIGRPFSGSMDTAGIWIRVQELALLFAVFLKKKYGYQPDLSDCIQQSFQGVVHLIFS
jgi:hypothetical protein